MVEDMEKQYQNDLIKAIRETKDGEVGATYIKAVKGELLFYTEDGKLIKKGDDMTIPENHENIKRFCNADNKEKKYLISQMIDSRFYKISDIITDVPVEHIEK